MKRLEQVFISYGVNKPHIYRPTYWIRWNLINYWKIQLFEFSKTCQLYRATQWRVQLYQISSISLEKWLQYCQECHKYFMNHHVHIYWAVILLIKLVSLFYFENIPAKFHNISKIFLQLSQGQTGQTDGWMERWAHFGVFTSSPTSVAYMRQWIGSALGQIMACHLARTISTQRPKHDLPTSAVSLIKKVKSKYSRSNLWKCKPNLNFNFHSKSGHWSGE